MVRTTSKLRHNGYGRVRDCVCICGDRLNFNAFKQWLPRGFPFLAWQRPDSATLKGDVCAGLTVGLMVIPQGVAYAALAGMPLVTGIYASRGWAGLAGC